MPKDTTNFGYIDVDPFFLPWPQFWFILPGRTVREASYKKGVTESFEARNVCLFLQNLLLNLTKLLRNY